MKKIGLLILGHNHLAHAFKEALIPFGEKVDHLETLDLLKGESEEEFQEQINRKVEKLGDCEALIILVDLAGSIPYKCASTIDFKEVKVIAGINLGMIIEVNMMRFFEENLDKIEERALVVGKDQILPLPE